MAIGAWKQQIGFASPVNTEILSILSLGHKGYRQYMPRIWYYGVAIDLVAFIFFEVIPTAMEF